MRGGGRSSWLAILLFCCWMCGGLIGSALAEPAKPAKAEPAKPARDKDEDYELQRVLVDTIDQVQRNYVREVSRRKLIQAAIKGILSELDPYSAYIAPEEMDRFRTTLESEFGGIGIQITMEGRRLKVLSPMVGTPAYRAGLTAGDAIVEIDGKSTVDLTIEDAVHRLKGKAGTQVTLTVIHPAGTAKETVTVTREMIHIDTVLGDRLRPRHGVQPRDGQRASPHARIAQAAETPRLDPRSAVQPRRPVELGNRGQQLVHLERPDREHGRAQQSGEGVGRP